MVNEEHYARLMKGVQVWNKWRLNNPNIIPELSESDLSNANLSNADLRDADLGEANLSGANLSEADLSEAYLSEANLSNADLSNADLRDADLGEANLNGANLSKASLYRAYLHNASLCEVNLRDADLNGVDLSETNLIGFDFSGVNLSNANFTDADLNGVNLSNADLSSADFTNTDLSWVNLRGANLSNANLSNANLIGFDLSGINLSNANLSKTDLSEANLSNANLSKANLSRTQALETDFTNAKFTGACLEGWNYNYATKLNNIDCQYYYRKNGKQERYPIGRNFAPGEFTKLLEKALETVDLIFSNGVDWKAFAYSFRKIQIENESSKLTIRKIEIIDDIVIVEVNLSDLADKTQFHSDFFKGYEFAKKELEPQFQARLGDKDKEINRLFLLFNQANDKLGEVPKLMAEQSKVQQNFHAPVYGVAGNVEGDFNNYSPEQKQNLAEAAADIQKILNQLAQTNPTIDAVTEAVHQEIKRNPTLKARLLAALKAGGLEALKAIFNHPAFSIPVETIKGYLEAE